jgi:hypothetical protein
MKIGHLMGLIGRPKSAPIDPHSQFGIRTSWTLQYA